MIDHPLEKLASPPRILTPAQERYFAWGPWTVNIGLFCLFLGLISVLAFYYPKIKEHFLFHNKYTSINAEITKINQSVKRETRSAGKGHSIPTGVTTYTYEISYIYKVDGKNYSGLGYYRTGQSKLRNSKIVPVEYVTDNPGESRLSPTLGEVTQDSGKSLDSMGFIGAVIFFIPGLIGVSAIFSDRSQILNLVRKGIPVMGEVEDIKTVPIGKHYRTYYTFRFTLGTGEPISVEHERNSRVFGCKTGDRVPMLCDPDDTISAMPLFSMPKMLKLKSDGNFEQPGIVIKLLPHVMFALIGAELFALLLFYLILR